MKYHCVCCNYITNRNNDFQKHLKLKYLAKSNVSKMYPNATKCIQNASKMYPKSQDDKNHIYLSVNIVEKDISIHRTQ